MSVLNGSKDLTLVEFLMGLASSGETAEYIQLYLGSSSAGKAAVAAFTSEFLKCGLLYPPFTAVPRSMLQDMLRFMTISLARSRIILIRSWIHSQAEAG